MFMPKTKLTIAAIAMIFVAIALSVTTSGLLTTQKAVPASGVIGSVDIEVYSNAAATQTCISIDWGTLNPGDTATRQMYIKNTGNTTETLHLSTASWNPLSASSMLTVTWDKEDTPLSAGSTVAATVTLTVGQNTGELGSFTFNIVIQGTA